MWFEKGTNINTRFILTMWYVNMRKTDVVEVIDCCFILTMWYVNYLCKS